TTASGRVLEGYNAIYDISNHLFYIQLENKEIRVLDGKLIDNYSWINAITYVEEFFVNCLYYEIDGKNTAGFFRILYQDELELLVKRNIRIRKADYIEGLDTGRREDTILKEDAYFVAKSGIAYPLSGKIKNDQQILAAVFPGFDLKTHVKGHQIDLKTQEGMLQLITFLNDAF
ncbi:MAG: hypothetical protein OEY56_09770, partial [Cyclobacteriaceae bacterium]|nr:hypothetical protein [Cyclobacteriaceae bacterium]